MSIRPISTPDEAARCARMMAGSEPWLTIGRSYEACLEIFQDPGKEIHVASAADRILAFLILDMRGPFSGYIQTVCVDPECRGQGLGRRFIEWVEERIFRERPNVFLCVSSFNHEARRLYDRMGYEVVGELKNYLVDGHSEILLRKTTGAWKTFRLTAAGGGREAAGSKRVETGEVGAASPRRVRCPFCGGFETRLEAAFGSTLGLAQYWCQPCRTVFEYLKWEEEP